MKFYKGDTFKHPSDGGIEVRVLERFLLGFDKDDEEYHITDAMNFTKFLRGFDMAEVVEVLKSLKFINYTE
jgi:hypothetical protein